MTPDESAPYEVEYELPEETEQLQSCIQVLQDLLENSIRENKALLNKKSRLEKLLKNSINYLGFKALNRETVEAFEAVKQEILKELDDGR